MRLYDTMTGAVRDFVPVKPGHASIYLCGATVQGLPHIGHVRSGVAFDVLRRWLMAKGYDVAFIRNVTDIDDKILNKAADAGRPWWEWAADLRAGVFGRLRRAGGASAVGRATGHGPHHPDHRADRAADRARACLHRLRKWGWRRVLRRAQPAGLREAVRPQDRRRAPGRGCRDRQARRARLHAVEGREAGRTLVADAVGPGPPGVAHRMRRDVRGVPRRRVRHPRRRYGSRLPAPRERDRPGRGRGRPVRPVLAAQRLGDHGRREDEQVAGQRPRDSGCAATGSARRAALLPGQRALPVDAGVLRERAAGRREGLHGSRGLPAPGAQPCRRRGARRVDAEVRRRARRRSRGADRARRGAQRPRRRQPGTGCR